MLSTVELTKANRTPDRETSIATLENRVIVTKDEDFVTGYLLRGAPPKLLLISTGNISNDALSHLVALNLANRCGGGLVQEWLRRVEPFSDNDTRVANLFFDWPRQRRVLAQPKVSRGEGGGNHLRKILRVLHWPEIIFYACSIARCF
jgi:hypothetical protein